MSTGGREKNPTRLDLISFGRLTYFKLRHLVQLRRVHFRVTNRHVHHHDDGNRKTRRQLRYQSFQRLWATGRNSNHYGVDEVTSAIHRGFRPRPYRSYGRRGMSVEGDKAGGFDLLD